MFGLFGKDKKKEEDKRQQAWQAKEAETEEKLREMEAKQEQEARSGAAEEKKAEQAKQPLEITKDTLIGQILAYDMGIADILIANGMACTGCMAAYGESLEMACCVHGIPVDPVLDDIHEYEARKAAGTLNKN